MTIHIIDDEAIITETLSDILASVSTNILCFQSAETYLEHRQTEHFKAADLIITDVRMQKMDGFTLIKHIRRTDATVKIIVMSGFHNFHPADNLYDASIEKPFNIPSLLTIVSTLLQPQGSSANI